MPYIIYHAWIDYYFFFISRTSFWNTIARMELSMREKSRNSVTSDR